MGLSHTGAKTIRPGPTRGRAGRQQTETAGPAEPIEGSATGAPASGLPDAGSVCRVLRLMRQLVEDMVIPGEPPRCSLVLVDDFLPVLDDASRLLEVYSQPPARARE